MNWQQMQQKKLTYEQAVLGACLIDERVIHSVLNRTNEGMYASEINKEIFQAIQQMQARGESIDPVTVLHYLHQEGSREYIMQLMSNTPTAANVSEYITRLVDADHDLRMRDLATKVSQGTEDDYQQLSDWLIGKIDSKHRTLPPMVDVADDWDNLPELPPELIHGVLRRGGVMLMQGASKAGKTYALLQLALSVSMGWDWLGFPVERGKVLYIDFELHPAALAHRIYDVATALNDGNPVSPQRGMLTRWALRGQQVDFGGIITAVEQSGVQYDLIVIDPVYKLLEGQENEAEAVGKFFRRVDELSRRTNTTVALVHHHSKGAQGSKRAIDRGSGSGVFGRSPDAILDLTEIKSETEDTTDDKTYFRLSFDLRDFRQRPINLIRQHPIMTLDTEGLTEGMIADGGSNQSSWAEKIQLLHNAIKNRIDAQGGKPEVKVTDLVKDLRKDRKTVEGWIDRAGLPRPNGIVTYNNN